MTDTTSTAAAVQTAKGDLGAAKTRLRELTPVTMEGRRVVLPEGTWIIGSKASPRTWAKIRSGEITGYSIAGFSMKEYREALATKATRPGIRRVLLRDLEEPMVGIVSYVRSPAVADAKFFALKSQRPGSEALHPSETTRDQIAALPTARDGRRLRAAMKSAMQR